MGFVTAWAIYAYYVNARRPEEDPQKRNYHPAAVLLVPVTFPIIIILSISFFILRVLTYGVFLFLFILVLIFMPRSSTHKELYKKGTSIGDRLLEINTLLVRFFLRPWTDEADRT